MEHKYIDEFAVRSPYSKADPRVKLVALIAFLVIAAFSTSLDATVAIFCASVVLAAGSRIPARHLLYGLAPATPFIAAAFLAVLLTESLPNAFLITLRVSASVLAAVIFSSTTPILEQARALQWFRIPSIIVSTLIFAYRFIFVFIDELERMKLARTARGLEMRRGSILKRRLMRSIGQTIGMLLVRVNNRAVRVFDSLRGRGFSGKVMSIRPLRATYVDALYVLFFAALVAPGIMLQTGVV
ncbi:MAG: energy-coupling factor transporter transmembrane component T [Thermoplasmata archaeon]